MHTSQPGAKIKKYGVLRIVTKAKMPKHVREQFRAARDLIRERNVDDARTKLLEIELGSSFVLFHRMMAACAFIAKDYDLASSHIEQALSLEPDKQPVIADAIRIYKTKEDIRRATELFEAFDINKASSGPELLRMALAMKSIGRFNEAATALERSLRLSPDNVRIRNQYGIVLTHLGRSEEAMRQWLFSLKFNSNDVQAKVCLGRMHLHRNESLKAIEYFKETLDSQSRKAEGRKLNLAEAYVRSSSVTEARELLSSVEGMDQNPRFHYLWGTLHSQAGDYYLAYSSFTRCIDIGKERGITTVQNLSWPQEFTSNESIREILKDVRPRLDSLFDALSLLQGGGDSNDSELADDITF